jgi:hypothetical protein
VGNGSIVGGNVPRYLSGMGKGGRDGSYSGGAERMAFCMEREIYRSAPLELVRVARRGLKIGAPPRPRRHDPAGYEKECCDVMQFPQLQRSTLNAIHYVGAALSVRPPIPADPPVTPLGIFDKLVGE